MSLRLQLNFRIDLSFCTQGNFICRDERKTGRDLTVSQVELALAESGAKPNKDFVRYEIDLKNKPEWYQPKVNSASKVCAFTLSFSEVLYPYPSLT